jgi:hypothetical protein
MPQGARKARVSRSSGRRRSRPSGSPFETRLRRSSRREVREGAWRLLRSFLTRPFRRKARSSTRGGSSGAPSAKPPWSLITSIIQKCYDWPLGKSRHCSPALPREREIACFINCLKGKGRPPCAFPRRGPPPSGRSPSPFGLSRRSPVAARAPTRSPPATIGAARDARPPERPALAVALGRRNL